MYTDWKVFEKLDSADKETTSERVGMMWREGGLDLVLSFMPTDWAGKLDRDREEEIAQLGIRTNGMI